MVGSYRYQQFPLESWAVLTALDQHGTQVLVVSREGEIWLRPWVLGQDRSSSC